MNDERTKLISDLVEKFMHEMKRANNPYEKRLDLMVADWFINRRKHKKRIEDSGYDVSIFPVATNERFIPSDYKTVDDFLQEPSGETEATFESHHGLTTRTFQDDLYDEINEITFDWFKSKTLGIIDADDINIYNDFIDTLDDTPFSNYEIEEKFCRQDLKPIVERYCEEVVELEKRRVEEARIKAAEDEMRSMLSKEVHEHACSMCFPNGKIEKFTMSNLQKAEQLISALKVLDGEAKVKIYVDSRFFETITSISLRNIIRNKEVEKAKA